MCPCWLQRRLIRLQHGPETRKLWLLGLKLNRAWYRLPVQNNPSSLFQSNRFYRIVQLIVFSECWPHRSVPCMFGRPCMAECYAVLRACVRSVPRSVCQTFIGCRPACNIDWITVMPLLQASQSILIDLVRNNDARSIASLRRSDDIKGILVGFPAWLQVYPSGSRSGRWPSFTAGCTALLLAVCPLTCTTWQTCHQEGARQRHLLTILSVEPSWMMEVRHSPFLGYWCETVWKPIYFTQSTATLLVCS
jgi:hypothetical protein